LRQLAADVDLTLLTANSATASVDSISLQLALSDSTALPLQTASCSALAFRRADSADAIARRHLSAKAAVLTFYIASLLVTVCADLLMQLTTKLMQDETLLVHLLFNILSKLKIADRSYYF